MRRLVQALVLPLAAVLALAVAVALTHREAPLPRAVPVSPTPDISLTPRPTSFPQLFLIPDDFRLLAPHAYGTITATPASIPSDYTFDVTLRTPPANLPHTLPVWNLAQTHIAPAAVAARFGQNPQPDSTQLNGAIAIWNSGLRYDVTHSVIDWLARSGAPNPQLGSTPRDSLSAGVAAAEWLRRTGLEPTTMNPPGVEQTASGESASFAEWTITWPRAAPDYPQWAIDSTVARVSADGTLKELHSDRAMIDKGSLYPLRPWQDALADARSGRWYRPPQPLPEFTTPGTLHIAVTVSLTYAQVDTQRGSYAVPMYEFSEGAGTTPGLIPALAP